ncbi:MAG: hypothetical protein SAL70_08740 [Scytonema sp. PMC 1070.18]|nr:hypothetical protein [Scytonema sp. PMC 1070.18]
MYQFLSILSWAVATFWGVLALANINTPAIAIVFTVWGILFLPPLSQRTQVFGVAKNIIGRIVIFIFAPVFIPIIMMSVNFALP